MERDRLEHRIKSDNGFALVSANDGWAVTNVGMIFRWNGTNWGNCMSPTTERLLSLFMVGDDSGWAVGYNGTIIHWTGIEWIPELSTGTLMLLLTGFTLISFVSAKKASRRARAEARDAFQIVKNRLITFVKHSLKMKESETLHCDCFL